jgi:4'-phosphopantetheinyl transferase
VVETPDLASDLLAFTPLPAAGPARVWWVSLDVAPDADAELRVLLTEQERQRADAYPHAARGRRFARGRAALRLLLGASTSRDPKALTLVANGDGKPALAGIGETFGAPHFNLSHAGDVVVIALCADGPVGIDLAAVDHRLPIDRVAPRFFSPVERAALDAARDDGSRRERFARLWVRKEAWLKGVGTGISERLRLTDFSAALDSAGVDAGSALALAIDDWEVRDVVGIPRGFVASVATTRVGGKPS